MTLLAGVGISPAMVALLPPAGVRRLSGWAQHRGSWLQVLFSVYLGIMYGAVPPLALDIAGTGVFAFAWAVSGLFFFLVFLFAAMVVDEMFSRWTDNFHAYGQAGFRMIRALHHIEAYSLAQKETAIRAAHAWQRLGRARGVDAEERTRRVFELLAGHPLDQDAATQVRDLVRTALLETASGKIDPATYQEPRGMWHQRARVELVSVWVGLAGGVLALTVPGISLLLSLLAR
ncbi:hypothetical protein ACFS27_13490 [Promicromonospora vindobonensis]|uniref:Uncharacterized protein n=1 Tax=Promicromonospora vindobonensis TaxID=195748 RepID=A0ABW5VUE2_9MICO